jgi:monoamine oxidase
MQQSPGTKVIIIGAGISGLVAALRLQQAGVVVLVLEKEPQVGGRVYSESLGGVPVNLGAQYFFKSDNKYLNRYVRKAKTFSPDSGLHGALWDGVPFYSRDDSFYADIPVDARALNDFDLSIKKMQKTVKGFSSGREFVFDRRPDSQSWYDIDAITADEYLSEFHPDLAKLFNLFLIPEGGAGVDETSALLLVAWYGQKGSSTMYLIDGGNQQLPQAMADDLIDAGGTVHLSTEVTEVSNTDHGVTVRCKDGEVYESDFVIVTAPASVTAEIVSGLSLEKREALDAVSFGASMQVGLYLRNMPQSKPVAWSVFHNESLNAFMRQTKKPAQNETVISLNIAGAEAYKMSDGEILQRVSHTLQKIYPDFDPEKNIADYSIKRWKDGIVRYPPGFLTKYQDAIRAPSGRVHFGGDYTHSPALDGAAWSGVRAADQILSALDSGK